MYQLILDSTKDNQLSYRSQAVKALADFRREWQTIAEGKSLIEVEAPVGLVLADIADWLQLNSQERHAILGGKLINQINCFMEEPVSLKLPS